MQHFQRGDKLLAVNVDDCEEGLKLNDVVTMLDRSSEFRDFIIVELPNGKQRQLEKSRFTLSDRPKT